MVHTSDEECAMSDEECAMSDEDNSYMPISVKVENIGISDTMYSEGQLKVENIGKSDVMYAEGPISVKAENIGQSDAMYSQGRISVKFENIGQSNAMCAEGRISDNADNIGQCDSMDDEDDSHKSASVNVESFGQSNKEYTYCFSESKGTNSMFKSNTDMTTYIQSVNTETDVDNSEVSLSIGYKEKCAELNPEITTLKNSDLNSEIAALTKFDSTVTNCVKQIKNWTQSKKRKEYSHKCDTGRKVSKRIASPEKHKLENSYNGPESKHAPISELNIGSKTDTDSSMVCVVCGKHFKSLWTLKNHALQHNPNKSMQCHICKKVFAQETSLLIHVENHRVNKRSTCDNCGKTFSRKADLKIHILTHSDEKTYKCTLCHKGFSQVGELYRHREWHNGRNTCKYCGKRLQHDIAFRQHVLAHEKELNITDGWAKLKCKVCGKVLKNEFNLKNHMSKGHKSVETICPHCDLHLAHVSSLNKHIRRKHTIGNDVKEQLPCHHCGLTFSSRALLTRHSKQEHQDCDKNCDVYDSFFQCDICGKGFHNQTLLISHIEQAHL